MTNIGNIFRASYVKNVSNCLNNASSLHVISSGFSDCSLLTNVTNSVSNTASDDFILTGELITDASYCFYNCKSIVNTSDVNIFNHLTNLTNISSCFTGCICLATIDYDLFYHSKSTIISAAACFNGCVKLTTISTNETQNGLFEGFSLLNNISTCFANNVLLSAIPQRMFVGCISLINSSSCFQSCASIKSIPDGLFDDCTAITTITACFYGFRNAAITANLFSVAWMQSIPTRNFTNCFGVTASSYSFTGTAPAIWLYNTSGASEDTNCFQNDKALSNYASIPAYWK